MLSDLCGKLLFIWVIVAPLGRQRPQGAKGFPRGEAVMKSRSSQRLFMTDEECGQKSYGFTSVRTSSGSFDFAIPHPSALRAATFPPGEGLPTTQINYNLPAQQRSSTIRMRFYIARLRNALAAWPSRQNVCFPQGEFFFFVFPFCRKSCIIQK